MKSIDQAKDMRQKVQAEIDRLPSHSLFGDSNAEEKAEMRKWVLELDLFIATGIPSTKNTQTAIWLQDLGFCELNDLE
jgi:hypothetical protein